MLCRSCTRSFMQKPNMYKKFKQLEEPNILKGQQSNTRPPAPRRATGRNHQTHSGKPSAFHGPDITGRTREGRAKGQLEARPSSNVNWKNNSSGCKLPHIARLTNTRWSQRGSLRGEAMLPVRRRQQVWRPGGQPRSSRTELQSCALLPHEPCASTLICAGLRFPSQHCRSPSQAGWPNPLQSEK